MRIYPIAITAGVLAAAAVIIAWPKSPSRPDKGDTPVVGANQTSDDLARTVSLLERRLRRLEQDGKDAKLTAKPRTGESAEIAPEENGETEEAPTDPDKALADREASFWGTLGRTPATERSFEALGRLIPKERVHSGPECRGATCRIEVRHESKPSVDALVEALAWDEKLHGAQVDYYWLDEDRLEQVIYVSVEPLRGAEPL